VKVTWSRSCFTNSCVEAGTVGSLVVDEASPMVEAYDLGLGKILAAAIVGGVGNVFAVVIMAANNCKLRS
jgi:hypothetical protein